MNLNACPQCRWWKEIGGGFGFCELMRAIGDEPIHHQTRAQARARDGGEAYGITFKTFLCNQFSKEASPQPAVQSPESPTQDSPAPVTPNVEPETLNVSPSAKQCWKLDYTDTDVLHCTLPRGHAGEHRFEGDVKA